jgi:hypothetical protein
MNIHSERASHTEDAKEGRNVDKQSKATDRGARLKGVVSLAATSRFFC